jgi:thiosulfate dehydrogenase [quinone] large subunit
MLAAFLESLRFIGHLLPVSFLRIFLGYVYLQKFAVFLERYQKQIPLWPSQQIAQKLLQGSGAEGALFSWGAWLFQHQGSWAFFYVGLLLAIAISYMLGYLVRPMAYIAALLVFMEMGWLESMDYSKLLLSVHIFLGWIGAGRVLGVDYYFYKRERGLWW